MKKLSSLYLLIGSLAFFGCDNLFNKPPKSCEDDHFVYYMNRYHCGINKSFFGKLPLKDIDGDGTNDFYVVANDGVIAARLTSKRDGRWYCLGTNGVLRR